VSSTTPPRFEARATTLSAAATGEAFPPPPGCAVCLKTIPFIDTQVRIASNKGGVELANMKMSMNPFCEIAVEEAVRFLAWGVSPMLPCLLAGLGVGERWRVGSENSMRRPPGESSCARTALPTCLTGTPSGQQSRSQQAWFTARYEAPNLQPPTPLLSPFPFHVPRPPFRSG